MYIYIIGNVDGLMTFPNLDPFWATCPSLYPSLDCGTLLESRLALIPTIDHLEIPTEVLAWISCGSLDTKSSA